MPSNAKYPSLSLKLPSDFEVPASPTLVLVFDEDVVIVVDVPAEDPLHHEHELVVRYLFIVYGNPTNVIP